MVCLFRVEQGDQLRDSRLRLGRPDGTDDRQVFPIPDDDSQWDVFIPDDDEIDPQPDPRDFWIEPDE